MNCEYRVNKKFEGRKSLRIQKTNHHDEQKLEETNKYTMRLKNRQILELPNTEYKTCLKKQNRKMRA